VLAEAAVRPTILQLRGIATMGDFLTRQSQAILDEVNQRPAADAEDTKRNLP